MASFFDQAQIALLSHAIDLAIASAKRGSNTSKQPEFKALYDKSILDYTSLLAYVKGLQK